jgi:hypothetical protein
MSTFGGAVSLSPQETIARGIVVERVAAAHHAHHAPKRERARRHVRAALLLRSLAERLDPSAQRQDHSAEAPLTPHAGSPRPWSPQPRAVVRRAPHRRG